MTLATILNGPSSQSTTSAASGVSLHKMIQLPSMVSTSGTMRAEVYNAGSEPMNRGMVVRVANAFPASRVVAVRLTEIDTSFTKFEEYTKTMGVVTSETIEPGEIGLVAWAGLVAELQVTKGGAILMGEWLRPHRRVPGSAKPIRSLTEMRKGWAFAISAEQKTFGSTDLSTGTLRAIILPWSV